MEAMGVVGMCLGTMGFIFGIIAVAKLDKLVKKLKELGVLEQEFKA